jgi:WD repeat-containing protein 6
LAYFNNFILTGEGPFFSVINRTTSALLSSKQVFESQAIHGIVTHHESEYTATLLVWGGKHIRVLHLRVPESIASSISSSDVIFLGFCESAADWILEVSIGPPKDLAPENVPPLKAALITAHNALQMLTVHSTLTPSSMTDESNQR